MGFGDDNENYTIVNGKAYTEDNVLVYNIFVHNIPRKTTKEQAMEYFKKFGEVESVRLINDRKRKNTRQATKIGFVNFCDPTVAAKVLLNTNHFLLSKRIRVRACDSWHQPEAALFKEEGSLEGSSIECEQDSLLLNLNEDCLEVIFDCLPLLDQINLARTCRRLTGVFTMYSKVNYKNFRLEELDYLTTWQTRCFFKMAGPQIETIVGSVSSEQASRNLEFMGTFCTNVKQLSIQNTTLKIMRLRKLLRKMTAVTNLELSDAGLRDSCIPIIRKSLPNLKVLSLEDNYEISGKYIKDLKNIESLSINGCRRITLWNIKAISESLTELNSLDIRHCPVVNMTDIQSIVNNLNKLETLKISNQYPQIHVFAQLPKLKHLTLFAKDSYKPLQISIFEELAKHQSNQLETLCIATIDCLDTNKCTHVAELKKLKKLMCPNNFRLDDDCLEKLGTLHDLRIINLKNCKSFTEKGLLGLIKTCLKLESLIIAGCKQIKDTFPKELLDMLKSQRIQRDQKKPLIVNACHTGFRSFVVNTPDFESSTDLLKFNFDFQFNTDEFDDIFCGVDFSEFDDDNYDYDYDYDFMGDDDEDDDDYYMYYSDQDDFDPDFDFDILQDVFFGGFQPYGDDIHDILF